MVHTIELPTGVTLQYAERGRASGTPVIFLHGVTDSWRSFEPVFPHLPPSIHAFALTQRGHGDSSRPADGYLYADLAGDVRAFMDAMQLPAAVIVGHSMGAMVAQRFAADHPTRVAGLVLMGSFASMHRDPGMQDFYDTTIAKLSDPIDPAVARDFQVSTLAHQIQAEQLDLFVNESLKVPARVWKALFRGFVETPGAAQALSVLDAPTLIVWGDLDGYASRADQEVLRGSIPDARLVIYENAGHAVHWENPTRFAKDLVGFIYERHQTSH
jgi:pimeloyl-ACP methyl ester carboxylesterase